MVSLFCLMWFIFNFEKSLDLAVSHQNLKEQYPITFFMNENIPESTNNSLLIVFVTKGTLNRLTKYQEV